MNITHEELIKALQNYFGFDTFKQAAVRVCVSSYHR